MAKLSRDAYEVPIGSPSKKEDPNSEIGIGSLLEIEYAKGKDWENKRRLIEICRKRVGTVSSGIKPLNIAVIGSHRMGKSSFINTIFASFSNDRWSSLPSTPGKDTTGFCKEPLTLGFRQTWGLHSSAIPDQVSTYRRHTELLNYRDDIYGSVIKSGIRDHTRQCNTGTPDSCAEQNGGESFILLKRNEKQSENTTENMARMDKNISLDRFIRIKDYCDQLLNFVIMNKAKQFSEAHKLWIITLTEDLMNTAYKSLFGKCVTTEDNDRLNNMLPRVIIDDKQNTVNVSNGAIGEKYQFQKQELVECEMCVDQNNALYWCKNCKMNICSFCKMYHETVKSVMNHEVYPLHIFF